MSNKFAWISASFGVYNFEFESIVRLITENELCEIYVNLPV